MLLAFVALSSGDAVGALTFGTPPGAEKRFAPRKGRQTLNALMAELGDVEPSPIFSDYMAAAADLMQRQRKRGLVVLITNCRDEDSAELAAALQPARSRHRVVLASLREADRRQDRRATAGATGIRARSRGRTGIRATARGHAEPARRRRRHAHRLRASRARRASS